MRLSTVRIADDRVTSAARQEGDELVLLPYADVGALLAAGDDWQERAASADGERLPLAESSLAPLVPHPNKIVCLGLNYATHIKEMGRPTPAHPTLFAKYDGALIGAHDAIHTPPVSDDLDWEAELAVVVGRPGRRVPREKALEYVAGYTVANDVTVRDWQHRTREFLSGKTFEATTPVGPALVTPDELPPGASGLDISCSVDGHTMQKSNTADLLFDVAETVAYISTIITLLPGDLILTGTPGGVGAGRDPKVFLRPGQVLITTVEGIGELRNTVIKDQL
ncbi:MULTISPECIES: fumarylacetoacetate hydrolase family protein [Streptomyces]|uniref:Acylpyruvate hydrolase n=7 Tax=Streptomyces TaxID=1883 RepID=A0A8I0PFB2_9ACTN|nr:MULTISPECIES: fumarylacetoacetate hydrolase family protein [Streptomyces]MBP5871139.1 fumarylacetoacetate hydrolase family protein [Streptomyces sp. LBUM 1485]MBP5932984.1 fumarylacetoacetate hydrolase family protein [Streptomyces sp. LBUM 1479]KFG03630.1 2-hydroxyhepta-2,4-diene-1,7-dioate isomerase [Streptomyces scabiei]KND44768.1 2-hydroxyhepta-2,4-diene-1,7-dioate isomerase [Streptomyces stelliscabiei]MBE1601546.1 acylpyruvate hydrolase [Streptomyces stelliscabiei]